MPSTPFSYFHRLSPEDQAAVRNVAGWRWIASVNPDAPLPDRSSVHTRWIAQPRNIHTPAHREIMLILEAQGVAYYGHHGVVYRRQTGRIFLFDHHESRDWVNAPHNHGRQTSLWLHFPLAISDSLTYNTVTVSEDLQNYREVSHRVYTGDAARLIPKAWDQCRAHSSEPAHWELLKAQVAALIMEILCTMEARQSPSQQKQMVNYLCRYITEHFADDLALSNLSDIAGYSPYFFHRIFRRHTGMTPKAYITHLRLTRAKELLAEGQKISAVSEAVGIQSPFTFSRFFKNHVGYSPAEWRERH